MFANLFSDVHKIQYYEPVDACMVENIPDTLEHGYLSKQTNMSTCSPEIHWPQVDQIRNLQNQSFNLLDSKFTPSPTGGQPVSRNIFATTEKKATYTEESEIMTFQPDSMSIQASTINLEPQYDPLEINRQKSSFRATRAASKPMLNRNLEYILSETLNMDQADYPRDERSSPKNAIGQSVLNIKDSFFRESMVSTGGSFSSAFLGQDTGKDPKNLQKSLFDLQRDRQTKSSYCNPCTLI